MPQHSPGGDDPAGFLNELAASHGKPQPHPQPPAAAGTIDVPCPCGKTLRAKARLAGKTVRCPACQTELTVPSPAPPQPAAFAIDTAAPAYSTSRARRGKPQTAKWLLTGGAALVVGAPLIYFAAFHKSPKKPKRSDASLASKSPAESEGTDDFTPLTREPVKIVPLASLPTEENRNAVPEPDPVAKTSPPKKTADPPPPIVKKPPKKSHPAVKVADKPKTPAKPAVVVSAENFDWLVGKSRTITLKSGVVYEGIEVASARPDSHPRSLHSLKLKRPSRKSKRLGQRPPSQLAGWKIRSVETPDGLLTLKYDKKLRAAVVERVATQQQLAAERAKERAEIVARLRPTGSRIWPELSKDDHQKAVAKYKEFLIKVGKSFAGRAMKFRETGYFLFYTNLPEAEVNLISKRLDAMYGQLCTAFGIPQGKNIWRGKGVIVAFIHPQDFQKFEAEFMGTSPGSAVQGLAHQFPDGRCIIGCYRGTKFDYFAQVLVHETSHGFLHRYYSSVHIPTWINEGMADWIANMVVPVAKHIREGQAQAVARIRTTHTLGGDFFTGGSIAPWQYGVASHLTAFMLRGGNGPKYRRFIEDIKKGYTWRQSLKRNYGVDENGLTTLYGRSLRIPNLVP